MKKISLILTMLCMTTLGVSAQTPDRFHVNVQAGDKARAALEAIRFVNLMSPDTMSVAGCALESAVGSEEYSDVARPKLAGRILDLPRNSCDPRNYQIQGTPVIYVEKVVEIKSNDVLPMADQIAFEVTLQTIRGEVQEWQVIKARPSGFDHSNEAVGPTIRNWRVVRFEVTGFLQTYFKKQ